MLANIHLPESRPGSPVDDEESMEIRSADYESYRSLVTYPPEAQWRYPYESSFRRRAEKLAFMAPTIVEETGNAWQIPEDGRSSLVLSLRGLGLEPHNHRKTRESTSGPNVKAKILSTIRKLGTFDKKLHESYGRNFYITDFDPWNSGYLTYKFRKPIIQDNHHMEQTWGYMTWGKQSCDVE
jgi:hypothetical protein